MRSLITGVCRVNSLKTSKLTRQPNYNEEKKTRKKKEKKPTIETINQQLFLTYILNCVCDKNYM